MVHETHFSHFSFNQLANAMKQRWQELVQTNASPQSIALAFAIGTFISVLPTPGLNLVLATLLASLFKQLNRTGLLAAIAVWNAFIVAPIYVLSHKVGASLPLLSNHNLAIGFLVGNMLLALVITAVSYLIVQLSIGRYQTRKIRA